MTRTAVVVSILLSACASQPRQATIVAVPHTTADSLRLAATVCLVGDTSAPSRDTVYVLGAQQAPAARLTPECGPRFTAAGQPLVVEVTLPSGADLRDALDGGLPAGSPRPDVIVTHDPDVLAYAARSGAFVVDTLPWSKLYLLISSGADSTWTFPSATERDALARDAVRGAARGALEPFPWLTLPACTEQMPVPAKPQPIVGYVAGDLVSQQLAERVVALAAARSRPAWIPPAVPIGARISAFAPDSLPMQMGRVAAVIVAVKRTARQPCGLRGVAPLVDIRSHVIVRRGSGAAFLVGTDGTLWFIKRSAP